VSFLAEENKEENSIYGGSEGDSVETSLDTSPDMFDDVFGEDEEKKAAKKKMLEKVEELKKKGKKSKVEEGKEDSEDEDDTDLDEKEFTPVKDPEIFVPKDEDSEHFETASDTLEAQEHGQFKTKKNSDFDDLIKKGLEKSIKSTAAGGKLNLKTTFDEEEVEEEEVGPILPVEKTIIKSVIKNKAQKVARDEEEAASRLEQRTDEENEDALLEDLMKEDGTREEGISERADPDLDDEDLVEIEPEVKGASKKGNAKNAASKSSETDITKGKKGIEVLADEVEEDLVTEKLEENSEAGTDKDPIPKPKLEFLMSAQKNAFIGRKKSVLGKYGEEGGLHVGRVYEDSLRDTNVYLDGLNPHVVFVCGARGSGKSYVLGVVAEELALKNKNVGIVVVDPIGVFWSMKHPNKEEKELEILTKWDMLPRGLDNVKVFIPVGMKSAVPKSTYDAVFSIQPALLTAEDWCLTFGIDRFSPTGLLMEKGIAKAKEGYTTTDGKAVRGKENTFSLEDLIQCFIEDSELNNKEKGYKADSIRALVSRFDAAKHWGIFDEKGTPLSLLSRAGQMTILDTSFLEDNVSALVIGIIARRLLSARKLSTRREAAGKFAETTMDDLVELNIPPTWLFIDEAHTLIPGGNQKTPASAALVEYVKQGRRPGLSLVFATQQPSAIDSRVLSQLDVIMAHKLVFDDDIKSIYKRTPAIIPWQYKKPSFIKTMPVGIALTGDRSETSSRAFVMAIRPRMSQHEGRDAETVEVKHELEKEQVEILAANIVLRQLEKDPQIAVESISQTLDSLNNTYKKAVTIETVLAALRKKGIIIEDDHVLAPGVKQEREREEALERAKALKEGRATKIEGNLDELATEAKNALAESEEDEATYETNVELMALQPTIDDPAARKILAKYRLKKALGLFGDEEIIDRLALKYAILYKVKFNYFSQKNAFQMCDAYVDSLTGEFIHDVNGTLVESKGLPLMKGLNETEAVAFRLLQKKRSLEELAKLLRMEKGNAKRVVDNLVESGLAIALPVKDKEKPFFVLKEKIDLPSTPLHGILPSIGKRPITEVDTVALIAPKTNEKEIPEMLKKLWGNVSVKEITHLFMPVWEAVMKKKTGEERMERIDAINGRRLTEELPNQKKNKEKGKNKDNEESGLGAV